MVSTRGGGDAALARSSRPTVRPLGSPRLPTYHSTVVDRHHLQLIMPERAAGDPTSRATRSPRLELTWLDRMAANASADGETSALVELVRASAESLCGDDQGAARARLLAREIAISKAMLDLMVAGIGERLDRGDARGTLLLDKLATGAAKRLALLTNVHSRAATIAVAHADVVHVEAAK